MKEAIRFNNCDLSAAEAECARIGVRSGRRACQRESARQRKFKKVHKDISQILEVAMQDSDEEEHVRAAPPSSWQAGTHRPCSAPTFSSSPKSVEQPASELWKSTRPPTGSPWQSQDCGYMERYEANITNQMPPRTPGPVKFPQQQQHPAAATAVPPATPVLPATA